MIEKNRFIIHVAYLQEQRDREREFNEKDGSNYAHFLKIDMGRKKELW